MAHASRERKGKKMNARSRILHPRRFAIVRDALAALWLSLLVGLCAAMTLALVVVLLASSAYAAIADEHLTAKSSAMLAKGACC
jgi:hypothetical protein